MEIRHKAFSLVEIVIALGVVSVAVIAIFGLFPVAYRDSLESQRETRAAFLAEQIVSDLRSAPFTNAVILSKDSSGKLAALTPFSLNASGVHVLAGDDENNVTRELGAADYDAPTSDASIAFLAKVKIEPTGIGGLSRIEVEVSFPASAPLLNRSRHGFFSMIEGAP